MFVLLHWVRSAALRVGAPSVIAGGRSELLVRKLALKVNLSQLRLILLAIGGCNFFISTPIVLSSNFLLFPVSA